MQQLEQARLSWQRAQADLQESMALLEKCVAQNSNSAAIESARAEVARRQAAADLELNRYITQLGKTQA